MKHRSTELTFTDLFCGAGGSTLGAVKAGAVPVVALNHWPRAVETYNTNHASGPAQLADISQSNPRRYPTTDILIGSPECTFHSPARGDKKPKAQMDLYGDGPGSSAEGERSRATMWDIPRFAEIHDYETIVIENVVEAKTKWPTFDAWLMAMRQLGYEHRELYLNSMHFGVPQSRDRLYVVFWKRGNRAPDLEFHPTAPCWNCGEWVAATQSFKNPHKPYGKYRTQYIYCCPTCAKEVRPYAPPAAVAIDWSLKGERIGDRKKPLADATMARIQAGIDKYWRKPGVVDLQYNGSKEARTVDEALFTQTARQTLALYLPFLARMRGTDEGQIAGSAHSVADAMGTLTAGGRHEALIGGPEPFYTKNFGDLADARSMAHLVGKPLGTVTAIDHHALVVPPGGTWNTESRGSGDPLATLTATEAWALVTQLDMAFKGHHAGRVRSVLEQLATLTTGAENTALVTTYHSRDNAIRPASHPLATQTAEPKHGLLTPFLAKAAGSTYDPGEYKRIRDLGEQLWSQTGTAETGIVSRDAFLASFYSGSTVLKAALAEAMATLTTQDRHALVEGPEVDIEDCFFRMLEPPEIGRGMAFPDSYKVTGNKRERVRQYGGAVTPPVEDAIMGRCIAALDAEMAA